MLRSALLAAVLVPALSGDTPPPSLASCGACHTFDARRDDDAMARTAAAAPDLSYAGSKYRSDWLRGWLRSPSRLRPGGYQPWTVTVASDSGDHLDASRLSAHPRVGDGELEQVVSALQTLRRDINPHPAPSGESPTREPAGAAGQLQFTKVLACGGCHESEPGVGGLSGPELYTASARLKPDWLRAFVADPRYWSAGMMPVAGLRAQQIDAISTFLMTPKPSAPRSDAMYGGGSAPAPASERGERLYRAYCTPCHGVRGDGRGINAPRLFVAPRNHRSAAEMGALTDDHVFAAIKFGGAAVGKASTMPAWSGTLADADIKLLVVYLRTLARPGVPEE